LSVVIAFPSAFANKGALARAIKKAARGRISIIIEGNCIVCEPTDSVEFASQLASLFGIEKVAIAKKVSSKFSDLSHAIIEVGTRVIVPGARFYIKVIQEAAAAKYDYVSRDIEFAASGALTVELSSIKARPAKNEEEATQLILTIIGKESAYICLQLLSASGGLVAGSRGKVLGSIHSSLSFLSSHMAAKAGFDSTIVLPYTDERELESNAKLVQLFALKTGRKNQTILAMSINVPAVRHEHVPLVKEKIISKILIRQKENSRIVFPFSIAVHPVWLIESIMQETLSVGKTPFVPLIFMSNELVTYARDIGINLHSSIASTAAEVELQKYSGIIESQAKVAIKHTKKLDLNVGPNYLHDIIDSI
jgi:hypothetical protein